MQKTNSRKIRSNAIAYLSNRSIGVLAMQSVPGGLLPLMAKYTVFSKPSTGQPVSGPNPLLEQFVDFLTGTSQTKPNCATGCGSTWHRECVAKLNRPTAELFRNVASYFGIGLSDRNLSGRQLPSRDQD
ncbi:MAG: hypothetical protein ACKO81_02690 [Planctomycetota bacterium]|jgi:hypothetical protein